MSSEATNLKRPASSPANREEKKTKEEECLICSKPATDNILECVWCERRQHASCSKLNNEQCNVLANFTTPNIVFFCSFCIKVFPVALRYYDSQSVIDSKVSALEKSVSEIQLTKTIINEIMKNVEIQLEKHQKAITALIDDSKVTPDSNTLNLVPPITEESVANIAALINAEQKEKEKRQLNIIVHNFKESTSSEGPSRKEDDTTKCKSCFRHTWGLLCQFKMLSA